MCVSTTLVVLLMKNIRLDSNLSLILSRQIFSLETIWMEGYTHGIQEIYDTNNPYCMNSKEFGYWVKLKIVDKSAK
tara:strand:+ start:5487 stop:5714 length:228 start_codon:yes stop_codon:yes gene_type:complete